MGDQRSGMRVRRVSEADIEAWLALEPGERLEITGEDLADELTPEAVRPGPMMFAGALVLLFGLLASLRGLLQGEEPTEALPGLAVAVVGLGVLYAGLRMRAKERRRAPVRAISAGGDGLVLHGGQGSTRLFWWEVDNLVHASRAYDAAMEYDANWVVINARPETWCLTFRRRAGRPLPVLYVSGRDAAGTLFIDGVRRILEARREGMLLPGIHGPGDKLSARARSQREFGSPESAPNRADEDVSAS